MKTRYCGENKIELEYVGKEGDRVRFKGRIIVENDYWEFDNVLVDQPEPTEEAYDIAASGAIHYGSIYSDPDLEAPEWAPPTDFAQEINDAISCDDRGYCIRREIDGADTYSG